MKRIALITGGYGAEREVSLKSAHNIAQYVDSTRYDVHLVDVQRDQWRHEPTGQPLDKNDGSIRVDGQRLYFDYAFVILHGTPAEDGKMQGLLDQWGLSYSCCDTFVSALTFKKFQCNILLSHYGIRSPKAKLVRKSKEGWKTKKWKEDKFPVFVKPNGDGSSFGITKVNGPDEIRVAIEHAFEFGDEVIIERGVNGRELTCGAIRTKDGLRILPVTEIKSDNEYFDFEAKYQGASQEITPADLSDSLTEHCQAITKRIYEKLGCRGPIRADFMMKDDTFFLIEVNTIPGLTEQSLIPQQVEADGWTMEAFVQAWIDATMS